MIGTTALIVGGILAGTQAASAAYSAKKAGDAAKTQAAAGQQAINVQQQQYDTTRANLAPWQAIGNGAAAQLAQRSGTSYLPTNGPPVPAANVASGRTSLASFAQQPPQPAGQSRPGAVPISAMGGAPRGTRGERADAMPANQAMVMVKAPNGETRQMPRYMANQAVAKGAQIVGAA